MSVTCLCLLYSNQPEYPKCLACLPAIVAAGRVGGPDHPTIHLWMSVPSRARQEKLQI